MLQPLPPVSFVGLLGSSGDSLDVPPSDGGLAVRGAPKPKIWGGGGEGSFLIGSGFGFFPPAMKLPTTTCIKVQRNKGSDLHGASIGQTLL